jgi:hypothetical protein
MLAVRTFMVLVKDTMRHSLRRAVVDAGQSVSAIDPVECKVADVLGQMGPNTLFSWLSSSGPMSRHLKECLRWGACKRLTQSVRTWCSVGEH